jgi:hypothetical protein
MVTMPLFLMSLGEIDGLVCERAQAQQNYSGFIQFMK